MPEVAKKKHEEFWQSSIPEMEIYIHLLSKLKLLNSKRIFRWKVVIKGSGTLNACLRILEVDIGLDYVFLSPFGASCREMVSLHVGRCSPYLPHLLLPRPSSSFLLGRNYFHVTISVDGRLSPRPPWSSWNHRYKSTARIEPSQLGDIHDRSPHRISHYRPCRTPKVDVVRLMLSNDRDAYCRWTIVTRRRG
jgi:hypothetical protein